MTISLQSSYRGCHEVDIVRQPAGEHFRRLFEISQPFPRKGVLGLRLLYLPGPRRTGGLDRMCGHLRRPRTLRSKALIDGLPLLLQDGLLRA